MKNTLTRMYNRLRAIHWPFVYFCAVVCLGVLTVIAIGYGDYQDSRKPTPEVVELTKKLEASESRGRKVAKDEYLRGQVVAMRQVFEVNRDAIFQVLSNHMDSLNNDRLRTEMTNLILVVAIEHGNVVESWELPNGLSPAHRDKLVDARQEFANGVFLFRDFMEKAARDDFDMAPDAKITAAAFAKADKLVEEVIDDLAAH